MKKAMLMCLSIVLARSGAAVADPVQSADDVCAPAADPCVISTTVEVDSAYPLDFGLRTVRVSFSGELRGSLDLSCGAFEAEPGNTWMTVLSPDIVGDVTITASRGCSLDAGTPCLTDTACSDLGLGTCSAGDGGIRIAGDFTGNASGLMLRAAGDIALEGKISAPGKPPVSDGGTIYIESTLGSVESASLVDVNAGINDYYGGPGAGGSVTIRAAGDVTLRNHIYATGGYAQIEVDAGNDIFVLANIFAQGRYGADSLGGTIDLAAGRDLEIVRDPELSRPVLNMSGGWKKGGYYGVTYGGPGGYGFLRAGGDLIAGDKALLWGDSGQSKGATDTSPLSGDWYFEAGDDISMDSTVLARAWGRYGYSLHGVSMDAGDAIHLGRHGRISVNGARSGEVNLFSANEGPISIDGRINVTGRKIPATYGGNAYGYGGNVSVYGGDISIAGQIRNGGPEGCGDMSFNGCRLLVKSGGKIDAAVGKQYDGGNSNFFSMRETVHVESGGSIRAAASGFHSIFYREGNPPVLDGLVTPAPSLFPQAGTGCPVCGNNEIDYAETCDDGNTAAGDGCDGMCLIE